MNMRRYYFTASVDAVDVDYETIIFAKEEPDFWRCNDLAERHGCAWWSIEEIRGEAKACCN